MERESLAYELMSDMKKINKRKDIIIIIIVLLWFATISLFVYYICNYDYVEETYTTEVDTNTQDNSDGSININGDVVNGDN